MDSSSDSDSLVFITYNDTRNGRQHDQRTRRIVRKRAFNASRTIFHQVSRRAPAKGKEIRFRLQKPITGAPFDKSELILPRSVSPFEQSIGTLGRDSWRLLGFCKQVLEYASFAPQVLIGRDHHAFRQNSIAINVDGDWLAFVMSDPVTIHAQLALISLTMDIDSTSNKPFIHHTSAALKLIRKKLDANSEPDDQLIGAVASLLIAESLQSEQFYSSPHYQALDAMLTLRGGYASLSNLAVLQRVVAWARRCYCLRWNTHASAITFPPQLHSLHFDEVAAHGLVESYALWLSPELLQVLASFRTIDAYIGQSGRVKRKYLSDIIYDVELELIAFEDDFVEDQGNSGACIPLSSLFHTAAHLYLLIGLRQVHKKLPLVQYFERILTTKLRLFSLGDPNDNDTASSRNLLLWITTVHSVAAVDPQARNFGLKAIRSLLSTMKISEWEEYQSVLGEVAWANVTLEKELFTLWHMTRASEKLMGKDG